MTLHIKRYRDRVSLPEKEFRKIMAKLEELEDIKAYDRAIKKIKAGKEEFIPWEEVKKGLKKRKHV